MGRTNRYCRVTPVNQTPEAVTTHGIRGQNTRGQIYRLHGRLVSCSSPLSPPLPSPPRRAIRRILLACWACTLLHLYVHAVTLRGFGITPGYPRQFSALQHPTAAMFIDNIELNGERTYFEIRFNFVERHTYRIAVVLIRSENDTPTAFPPSPPPPLFVHFRFLTKQFRYISTYFWAFRFN